MASEDAHALPGRHVPQPHRLVTRPGCDVVAVGVPAHALQREEAVFFFFLFIFLPLFGGGLWKGVRQTEALPCGSSEIAVGVPLIALQRKEAVDVESL